MTSNSEPDNLSIYGLARRGLTSSFNVGLLMSKKISNDQELILMSSLASS